MKITKASFIFILLLPWLSLVTQAQILKPISWRYEVSAQQVKTGEEVDLIFRAKIDPGWYLYSSDFDPDLGPMVTTFTFQKHPSYALVGGIKPINPKKKFDKEIWNGEYTYFTGTAEFRQRIKVLQPDPVIKGSFEYQVCTDVDGRCIPFEEDFAFDQLQVAPGSPQMAETASAPAPPEVRGPASGPKPPTQAAEQQPEQPAQESGLNPNPTAKLEPLDSVGTEQQARGAQGNQATQAAPVTKVAGPAPVGGAPGQVPQTLWAFALMAFGAGFLALLTPCVFPMVPMTVSFFTGSSSTRGQAIFKGVFYGLSIITIYTLAGVIVSRFVGPETANFISTHWLPNVLFFLVFLIFGMSFLGLFEITLPNWLVNKADAKADRGGWIGIFFMAFTLVLVSFSCTGPIVGSILVASAGGETLKPVAGMLAYSLAFALPFALFAVFPSWMSSLPKSGGWLNVVKVCLGFIELALALKFLSMADQAYHWRLLDREVYLAFWIVIFSLMGVYLLGKLKFAHDADLPYLSVPRLLLALLTFAFVVYLIPGMFGAPLKALAGYLPPQSTHDFDIQAIARRNAGASAAAAPALNERCETPKHADFLSLPHGLTGYFDLEQAKRCAQALNKPIFIDFTGHACVNCREMEARVWSDPQVLRRLQEEYVVVALYVDDKKELPESEWYTSSYDKKVKKTIGKQNADLQITAFNNNAQPYYVLMDPSGRLLTEPVSYTLNVQEFVNFLDRGLKEFNSQLTVNRP
jgi:thiol:disulfide interchange protein